MTQVTISFQWATMIVFAMTGLVAFIGFRRWSAYRGVFVPAGLVSLAGVIFYATLLAGRMSVDQILMWGAALRFVMAANIFGATMALAWALGGKHGE